MIMPPGGRGCHLSGAISGCSSPREPQQLPSGSNLAFFWNFFVSSFFPLIHHFDIYEMADNFEILQMAERTPNLYFVIHETQKRWKPLYVFQTKLVREKIQRKRIRGAKEVVSPQE